MWRPVVLLQAMFIEINQAARLDELQPSGTQHFSTRSLQPTLAPGRRHNGLFPSATPECP
ncbi:hypothetical protein YV76_003603 [Salmonella enterica subsp. enterica]|nr:hypothetical protein [Salmonella enterica subsp. enterica]